MSEEHIPRPPNCFIIYRSKRMKELQEEGVSGNLGAIATEEWKNFDEKVKEIYKERAKDIQKQHREQNPEWKFRPRTKEQIALAKEQAAADRLARRSARAAHPYANARPQWTGRASSSSASSSSASSAPTCHNTESPLLPPLSSVFSFHDSTRECTPKIDEAADIHQRLLELNVDPDTRGPITWNAYLEHDIDPMKFLHPTDRKAMDLSRFNPALLSDEIQLEIAYFSEKYIEPLLRSHGMCGQLYPDDEELADMFAYPKIFSGVEGDVAWDNAFDTGHFYRFEE
ncbi:hypothetical protein VNI00_015416 [Paramarasmius palmivorus]|uniref:HMG box domain-containing protein n=1 Tax=Paramarasmius palmivorus TaxID=297713 RepID=A0AAW0BL08_9AGAR